MTTMDHDQLNKVQYITEDDVKLIVAKYGFSSDDTIIENYEVKKASQNKLLGFLAEYLKLKICITSNNEQQQLCLFIKAISKTNEEKAKFVTEANLFEKESKYYTLINGVMKIPGLKPWTPKFVTTLQNSILVMDDLHSLKYRMRSKYERFDEQHTLQALNTLARLHASTLIFEEKKSRELQRPYRVTEDYGQYLVKGLFSETDSWFSQCRDGSLEVIKLFSKYNGNVEALRLIESRWRTVFNSIIDLSESSDDHRRVITHRDLWNNNILFHYKKLDDNSLEPDDCVLVDFQTIYYQPPAADVMALLHCNLEKEFRKNNMNSFLNYYYTQLETILTNNGVNIHDITNREKFMKSAEIQRKWGLVVSACFVQIMWADEQVVAEIYNDSERFQQVLVKNKGTFMKDMIERSDDYRKIIMRVFEEVIDEYVLNQ